MRKNFFVVFLPLCLPLFLACNRPTHSLFKEIRASYSGIDFRNTITENNEMNPLDIVNIYNGGGVGVGDFNNDGLPDLYFTGNQVSSKLYLNRGNFKFEDITDQAGVGGNGRFSRGVSVVDINNDGLPDIYVCNTIFKDSSRRKNALYVNLGCNSKGIPRFKEMAREYGLECGDYATMASFFDYDNDGDLDMYLTVNAASTSYNPNLFGPREHDTGGSRGHLYRNDRDEKLGHAVFHDVSAAAGITLAGYGHAATTVDINGDGWKDIYVSNDFAGSNILYINNKNGTFRDSTKEYFKHTSYNAMGQDIVDINNDGLPDVIELDMNPADNFRKKMILGPSNYTAYENFDYYGYQYQYVRNTLQLNQGPRLGEGNKAGAPAFSEIGSLAGMSQTDWSWTPLVADFNNDGFRDMIVTNGFPRDVSDRDFMTYRQQAYAVTSKMDVFKQIPQVKLHNYGFLNNGDLTFRDVTTEWGFTKANFSNGAVYVDLDNDGALDVVTNNINDPASIFRNTSADDKNEKKHFLDVAFKGNKYNRSGIGAVAEIYYSNGKKQVYENNPYRGYLSTGESKAHFGLGRDSVVDSLVIRWSNLKKQVFIKPKADTKIIADFSNASQGGGDSPILNPLFTEITTEAGVRYIDRGASTFDFNIQKLLPHKLSEYGPALASADLNGDGLDDFVAGGNSFSPAKVFLQSNDGRFVQHDLFKASPFNHLTYTDGGLLLFDANGDGYPDLYIASGGYMGAPNTAVYQDRLYLNNGKGDFSLVENALPSNYGSKLCVRSLDYNNDGKPDLFISGRVEPWAYPKPVSSIILRNDSDKGKPKFTDVTAEIAPQLKNIGLVCDALVSDYDNDGWPDIILAGEWMPVTFFHNQHGRYINVTGKTGIGTKKGWWNAIAGGDFRHTGRMDYILGNLGENSQLKASPRYPVAITAKDFDNNGSYTAVPSYYLPASQDNGTMKEFPLPGRDDLLKQMISMKKKFTNYHSYATATMDQLFSAEQLTGALRLEANEFRSCYCRNDGNGKFTLIPLPVEAQFSVINGMVAEDFDGDGNLDIAINGNDFGTDVSIGRYDALNGLLLKGNGKGEFRALSILQSGIYIPGNGKAMIGLVGKKRNYLLVASQNKGALKLFKLRKTPKLIRADVNDRYAIVTDIDGRKTKTEFYDGTSFLSQSGRFFCVSPRAMRATVTDRTGKTRNIKL